jgi:phytoene synthase
MRKGTKSFSLAALFFDAKTRRAVELLYAWLRHCDDQIDQAPNKDEAARRLDELVAQTARALAGEEVSDDNFRTLQLVFREYSVPSEYAFEFLEGMRMDLEKSTYATPAELELYCFRVAGVVGLMMTHIMGVSDVKALRHAADLGMAMQMTNIARDVEDDATLGRTYLPQTWIQAGLSGIAALYSAVRRMLSYAEHKYASGIQGLLYLPLKAGLAVACAALIYRQIGVEVLRRGHGAWQERVVISFPRKILCLLQALKLVSPVALTRLWRPWRRTKAITPWRYYPAEQDETGISNYKLRWDER